jgi:hypothetical protein
MSQRQLFRGVDGRGQSRLDVGKARRVRHLPTRGDRYSGHNEFVISPIVGFILTPFNWQVYGEIHASKLTPVPNLSDNPSIQ